MLYIKDNFGNDLCENQFEELWIAYWKDHLDLSKPEFMKQCLSRHFNEADVQKILEGGTSPKYKKRLTDETARLVEKGAFGAPWFIVRNSSGKEEPFFGSDRYARSPQCREKGHTQLTSSNRFHFMLQYLDVPFSDITIQPAKTAKL